MLSISTILTIIVLISITGAWHAGGLNAQVQAAQEEKSLLVLPDLIKLGEGNEGYEGFLSEYNIRNIRTDQTFKPEDTTGFVIEGNTIVIHRKKRNEGRRWEEINSGEYQLEYIIPPHMRGNTKLLQLYKPIKIIIEPNSVYVLTSLHLYVDSDAPGVHIVGPAVPIKLPHKYNPNTGSAAHPIDNRLSFKVKSQNK
jgi:hypothetical protein